MTVLNGLHDLGEKILSFFGNSDNSHLSHSELNRQSSGVFSSDAFAQILPYQVYDGESGLFIGENSAGFVIETLPLVGADESSQKEISSLFEELLEEGANIQCLLWGDPRTSNFLESWKQPRVHKGGIYQEVSHRRVEFLKHSKTINPRLFRFILSYSIPVKEKLTSIQIDSLKDLKERMIKSLGNSSYSFSWNANDFILALDGLVNFKMTPDSSKRKWDEFNTLSEQLPASGVLRVCEEQIEIKNETDSCFKSYRVVDYPDSWSLSRMHSLIGDFFRGSYAIRSPFIIHYGVHCPNQDRSKSDFWRKMQLIENQGKSSVLRRMIPKLEEELEEYNFVHRKTSQETKFVRTQLSIGLWSEKNQLASVEQSVKGLFRINQFSLKENTCLHLPHLLSFLPMTWGEYVEDLIKLNLLKTTISTECGNLVPILGEWIGTSSPGMILLGRRGQLLNWNPFDNNSGNYNCVVVGRSGSGKSVFMQELLMSSLGTGSRVFIIDVGRSYEKMAYIIGGQQIEFSKDSFICLNPFTHISLTDEKERDQSFGMLKSVISSMASPSSVLSDYEKALVEKAVRNAWEEKKNCATISDVSRFLSDQIQDEKARALSVMLTPYCKGGIYSSYFEGENNVDFTSEMVLIELEELKEKKDLQAVVLQIFIMTITNQTFLGDRKSPFHICIDEAWDLLRGGQAGEFIETLARRLRKYNGSLVVGTQSIEDFYASPGAQAAYENSDWMCLLSQKTSSINSLMKNKRIDIDEYQQKALESVHTRHGEYSEVMICDSGGGYSIGRLVLDPFSCLLYSTKAEEYAQIKALQNKGMSISEAIKSLISESVI